MNSTSVAKVKEGPRDYDPALDDKLSFWEKMSYGMGDISGNVVQGGVNMFLNQFLTNVAGIGAGVVGIIQLVSRIFDGVSDLVSGLVVDKTLTKQGKARPWLARLAIPYAIAIALLFWSPNASMNIKVLWAFISYNLVVTGVFTFTQTPYGALCARMTSDMKQRDQLGIFRMIPQVIATFVIAGYTVPMVNFFGGGQAGWLLVFTLYGAVSALSLFLAYLGTKERLPDEGAHPEILARESAKESVPPIWENDDTTVLDENKKELNRITGIKSIIESWSSIKTLFTNKYWVIQLLSSLFQALDTISGGVMMYYLMYIQHDTGLLKYFGLSGFVMAFSLFFVAPFAIRFVGKKYMAMSHFVYSSLSNLLLFFNPTSKIMFIAINLIKPFFAVGNATTRYTMLADAADFGEWRDGVRNEGLMFSAASFGNKLGQGIASALSMILLGLAGYVSSTNGAPVDQPESAIKMTVWLFCFTPFVVNAGGAICLMFWDYDKKKEQITAELTERRHGKTSA